MRRRAAGNWRSALEDARYALKLAPANVKATFRAARAAAKLGRLELAGRMVEAGLASEPGNKELGKLKRVRVWLGGLVQRVQRVWVQTRGNWQQKPAG
jgi:hypothetical protein